MSIESVLKQSGKKLKRELQSELKKQGHRNTGNLEASFKEQTYRLGGATTLLGYANGYFEYLDRGVKAESVSWRQFPFVYNYFKTKGLDDSEARRAAGATIAVWMKEGMPTAASHRFSSSGERKRFIEIVKGVIDTTIDNDILTGIDNEINKVYHQTKSETI